MEPTGQTSVRENWVTFHAISAFGACEKLLHATRTCETEWHSIDWCLSPENNVYILSHRYFLLNTSCKLKKSYGYLFIQFTLRAETVLRVTWQENKISIAQSAAKTCGMETRAGEMLNS